jgi:hypothetical protein
LDPAAYCFSDAPELGGGRKAEEIAEEMRRLNRNGFVLTFGRQGELIALVLRTPYSAVAKETANIPDSEDASLPCENLYS